MRLWLCRLPVRSWDPLIKQKKLDAVANSDSIYLFWSTFELGALRTRSCLFIAFRIKPSNGKCHKFQICQQWQTLCHTCRSMHSLTYLFVSVTSVQHSIPHSFLCFLLHSATFCYILSNKRQPLPVISLPFICLGVKIPRKAKWTPQRLHHVTLLYRLLLFVQRLYRWQTRIRSWWKFIF